MSEYLLRCATVATLAKLAHSFARNCPSCFVYCSGLPSLLPRYGSGANSKTLRPASNGLLSRMRRRWCVVPTAACICRRIAR